MESDTNHRVAMVKLVIPRMRMPIHQSSIEAHTQRKDQIMNTNLSGI